MAAWHVPCGRVACGRVDYLSTVVLRFGAAILALAITAISFAIFYASFTTTERAALTSFDASITYLIFGLSSYICALLPLSFVGGIMLNIIDAAYAVSITSHNLTSHHIISSMPPTL
jgi:uncharacterized membrane protein